MSRTPQPGGLALLRSDGTAAAALVVLTWWSSLLLGGVISPVGLATAAALGVGVVIAADPRLHRAVLARLVTLVRRPRTTPAPTPRSRVTVVPAMSDVSQQVTRTVRRPRAPGAVPATV